MAPSSYRPDETLWSKLEEIADAADPGPWVPRASQGHVEMRWPDGVIDVGPAVVSGRCPAEAELVAHVHDFVRWANAGRRLADALRAGVPVEKALAEFDGTGSLEGQG